MMQSKESVYVAMTPNIGSTKDSQNVFATKKITTTLPKMVRLAITVNLPKNGLTSNVKNV